MHTLADKKGHDDDIAGFAEAICFRNPRVLVHEQWLDVRVKLTLANLQASQAQLAVEYATVAAAVGTAIKEAGLTPPATFGAGGTDAKAVAKVIRLWLNDNGRWNSPKFTRVES